MNIKSNVTTLFFIMFKILGLYSQNRDSISIRLNHLEEVVITGQYSPQSVKKSVFEVKIITRAEIDRQAGNNLADLLNQELNINIIPNASTGKSGIQLFGLDAQYFKILIDNVPIINDEGLGNNTDLTQINLDDIEQIEIIEGSMGVEYGANAVSGVINIITKKSSQYKWGIIPYIQQETVGREFNFTNKGRHIQSLKIERNINENIYGNILFTRNNFNGFWNDKKGRNHPENDGLRGYEWLPKTQLIFKSLVSYNFKNSKLFYKFELFDEITNRFSSNIQLNYNPIIGLNNPIGKDEIFTSTRYYHHLNASGKFNNKLNYDISISYQQQKRDIEKYNYQILTRKKFDIEQFEYEYRKAFFSKGNFANFLRNEKFDLLLGYEMSHIDGYVSQIAGSFNNENIRHILDSYDAFTSLEINNNRPFSFRPGVRLLFSSQYKMQTAISLSSKYIFGSKYELRAVLGTSPRLPNYEELFTYFVDVNHDVRGNADLKPEQGRSVFIHLKNNINAKNNIQLQNKFSAWYIDVKDRIELIIINQSPLSYKYNNINLYKTWGIAFTNTMKYAHFIANLGISFSGISKALASYNTPNNDYLYSIQFNPNISYTVPKWQTSFSIYVKYNGPQYQFVQKQNNMNETILVIGKQEGFTWLDATIKKSFLQNKLETTLGVRNLFNITTINTTTLEADNHVAPAENILMGYGRSYFLKLLYNLNI